MGLCSHCRSIWHFFLPIFNTLINLILVKYHFWNHLLFFNFIFSQFIHNTSKLTTYILQLFLMIYIYNNITNFKTIKYPKSQNPNFCMIGKTGRLLSVKVCPYVKWFNLYVILYYLQRLSIHSNCSFVSFYSKMKNLRTLLLDEELNKFFRNLLPLCHQPAWNALFMGKIGWWQQGGRWQQNEK